MTGSSRWKIRVDTGGTFTDCWALEPGESGPRQLKLLSSGVLRLAVDRWLDARSCRLAVPDSWSTPDGFFIGFQLAGSVPVATWDTASATLTLAGDAPEAVRDRGVIDLANGEEAPVLAARLLTGVAPGKALPPLDLRLATTRGTNALLEKKGAEVALFITRGFGDLLAIRDQRRADLFALDHYREPPIPRHIVEVDERLDAEGGVLGAPDLDAIENAARDLHDRGCDSAAVALLHSYRNPRHELAIRDRLRAAGFRHISLSSELAPLIKLLPRAQTAAVNATLAPVMRAFIDDVAGSLGDSARLLTMTSAGGLESPLDFHPKDSLFSGPAAGVVGAAAAARRQGGEKLITFDMGGTSTDVARYDGDFIYQFEQQVGDARLLAPALKIATVAAGGGSICLREQGRLRVGPESAGAFPGPACYGNGGPLTLTDVNLLLGRIDAANFGIPLGPDNLEAAARAARDLAGIDDDRELDESFLTGLLDIAVEQMADSIREISVREGADPSDYQLLAFGGAGPLHACAIAERLGIDTVLVPMEAGILSAFGLHHARLERFSQRQVLQPLAAVRGEINEWLETMGSEGKNAVLAVDAESDPKVSRRIAELRLRGQDAALSIDITNAETLDARFRDHYTEVFGYPPADDHEIELVALRVVVATQGLETTDAPSETARRTETGPVARGDSLHGPLRIQDHFSTCWLAEGWRAEADSTGSLVLRFEGGKVTESDQATRRPGAIRHELFRHRFGAIVEEMGAMLERSAVSTNVKERLDFSCALLDAGGRLIVNAPHIPVHLGALGECVRRVTAGHHFRPGDIMVTNHPAYGGSHLPDVTVISAVFDDGGALVGYLANRAHHAEIGGCSPGSMPPAARSLTEEGVVISPTLLFDQGKSNFDQLAALLEAPPFPTRRLADNLADLNAQVAANRRGEEALRVLLQHHGPAVVVGEFEALASVAAQAIAARLKACGFASGEAEQRLDDGSRICVRADLDPETGRLRLDFSGTSPSHPGNLNATPAIVSSALLYVLRLFVGRGGTRAAAHLPLNDGLLAAVDVELPACFLNPKFPDDPNACPAVVGGNVETSQRLVDTLIQLFDLQACSQGTMNNLIFGDGTFGYYETIGGGAGAGDGYHGMSGLHTHMTNTAITDPEILESRYPVRLRQFSLRRESGGAGRFRGGDGLVREVEFLRDLEVSLLTQHRREGPFGAHGGAPGRPGKQVLIRNGGAPRELDAIVAFSARAGDVLHVETPGGGGFGTRW